MRRPPRNRRSSTGPIGGAAGAGMFVQGVFPPIKGHGGPPLILFVVIIGIAGAGALILKLLEVLAERCRRSAIARRRRRDQERAAATAELRARSLMSELCPHGWRAQLTLFAVGDQLPPGAPRGERGRVALDWAELAEGGEIVVARRVWASSIAAALDAMVADRRTDETLERIERADAIHQDLWPDA
jgi:hypothetical protein